MYVQAAAMRIEPHNNTLAATRRHCPSFLLARVVCILFTSKTTFPTSFPDPVSFGFPCLKIVILRTSNFYLRFQRPHRTIDADNKAVITQLCVYIYEEQGNVIRKPSFVSCDTICVPYWSRDNASSYCFVTVKPNCHSLMLFVGPGICKSLDL